ncbi:MAG: WcaF family extracellular polysaccharide biosynthesis acetyltransferase [Ferruginibacter sp.]
MNKTALAGYNNSWYRPGNPLKRLIWYFINIMFFKSSLFPFYGMKVFFLRLFGATVGKGVLIKPNVNIKYPWFLTIGDHVWIGEQVWIDNLGEVSIGNNSCISQGALLLSGNHNYTDIYFGLQVKPIILEEGVWIGAGSIVSGGSVCRSHTVLTAGSVSSGETEPYSIYRGNPAVKIKDRILMIKDEL